MHAVGRFSSLLPEAAVPAGLRRRCRLQNHRILHVASLRGKLNIHAPSELIMGLSEQKLCLQRSASSIGLDGLITAFTRSQVEAPCTSRASTGRFRCKG